MPEPADLGDLWLTHALSCLLDACEVPTRAYAALLEGRPVEPGVMNAETVEARRARHDACRLAVLFGALAVEARMDRLLRGSDATDWPSIAHLTPPERFRMARRLLDGPEQPVTDMELYGLALDLFSLRDELVDAVGRPGAALMELASEFSPSRVRAMVAVSGRLCEHLAELAGEDDSRTATIVRRAAEALTRRASAFSTYPASRSAQVEWEWAAEFPPEIVGS